MTLLKLASVRPASENFVNLRLFSSADVLFCSFFLLIVLSIEGRHTGQEAVELHQELKVDVLALGRLSVCAAHMVTVQIDTCRNLSIRSISII